MENLNQNPANKVPPREIAPCRRCGARIFHGEIGTTGRWHPIDAKPERALVEDWKHPGRFWIHNIYKSHFASCPETKEWRRNRKQEHHGKSRYCPA